MLETVLDKLPLKASTPKEWIDKVLADFGRFMQDHAACERKASALAMSMVAKYPDREALVEPMICLAKEEMAHFHEVYRLLHQRGLTLANDEKDPYVVGLLKFVRHGREEHFLDKLIVSALIEARSCERLGLVAEALEEEELRSFYRRLAREEAGHYMIFIRIARFYFGADVLQPRLEEWLDHEARIMLTCEFRAAVH